MSVGMVLYSTSDVIRHRPQYDAADRITLETTPVSPPASSMPPEEFEARIKRYQDLAEKRLPLTMRPQ